MKIATYNVNGVNGRLPVLLRWLDEAAPDVVCLQELKAPNEKFPIDAIREAGYGAIWQGQKSWNGVAILAKGADPVEIRRGLPGDSDDTHSRYIEAAVEGIVIACLYLPNGNPAPGPKFDYKLRWFERLQSHAADLLQQEVPVVLAGDFNVMPTELDVYKVAGWEKDALFRPEVRECFSQLVKQGWTDALREKHPDEKIFTYWDYFRNAYGRDAGLRIDHLLLSPDLAGRLRKAEVDREVRGWEKSSDHAPVWIELGKAARKSAGKTAKKAKTAKRGSKIGEAGAEDASNAEPLGKYKAKRNFNKTPEPGPGKRGRSGKSFVIQEHHARRHHYDLRLEIDGVLVSWAVPKEIPQELESRRLAVHVEDHPLEYGKFEGVIPQGNYGAGTVSIWDKGEWEPLETNWRETFAKGTLKFFLKGDRLNAPYILARMKEDPNWMLKMLDPRTHPLAGSDKPEKEKPHFVSPELARVVSSVPSGADWIHEIKLDGYRLIAVQKQGDLRLYTRSGLDWTDRFGPLPERIRALDDRDFVLDGEAVVFDEKGRSRFGDLQAALKSSRLSQDIVFVAFDILHLDGLNLRVLPLRDRLKRLHDLVPDDVGAVRRSAVWPSDQGPALFRQACKNDLEGIISKEGSARYLEGSRKQWTKSKCRPRQEFVICGYVPPKSSLPAFSSLVLGSVENGRLVSRGKVGTGFTESDRVALLKTMKQHAPGRPHFEVEDRDVVWLKPDLVCEIEYAEITRDGSIRQGSFIALREDKAAGDVHLEGLQAAVADPKSVKVAGIVISHPDRVVYPGEGISKVEIARYVERVGELMLPFVANRPLAIIRAPNGISGDMFFQKSFPTHLPAGVIQKRVDAETEVFFVKDVKGLVSLTQFGAIEIHPWGSPIANIEQPDFLIWDLDPEESVTWDEVLGAAFLLRDFLAERGLKTIVKTSGGKGLHIVLHLKRKQPWETMKAFAKAVAGEVAKFNPLKFTIMSTKSRRTGKIYIDWMRNGRGATCIAPWGVRARPGATVSMPLNWAQIPELAKNGYTIHMPPENPEEWVDPKPHSIPAKLLRELGID